MSQKIGIEKQSSVRGVAQDEEEDVSSLSFAELIREIGGDFGTLARQQMDLARTEITSDLKTQVKTAGGLGIGALLGFLAAIMLLVTAVFALSLIIPGWLAGLIISGVLLITGAVIAAISWRKRVTNPLVRTREQLKTDLELAQKR